LEITRSKNGKIEAVPQTFETPFLRPKVPLQNPELPPLAPHLNISVLKVLTATGNRKTMALSHHFYCKFVEESDH
jgi:hypothetical protein